MKRTHMRLGFAAILFVLVPLAAMAQDVVTVGTVTSSSSTVAVPVSIRDTGGTPLGVDQPAGSKIQAWSLTVNYDNASMVSSVTFTRAGIAASLTPSFESSPSSSGSITLLDSFQESTNPVPFTLNAGLPGNQVALLTFHLNASATPGTTIHLTLDPSVSKTDLTNQAGTTKETVGSNLTLTNGSIIIPPLTITLAPPSGSVNEGSTLLMTANLSNPVSSATVVTLSSSNTAVATVPASITVQSGQSSAQFNVTGVGIGSTTITATLPNTNSATAGITGNGPGISLTPSLQTIAPGGTGSLTAAITAAQSSSTTITLTSSDATIATVPATAVIPSGQKNVTFTVTGVAVGTASITAQLPSSLGSRSQQAQVMVSSSCVTPVAPQISGPADSPSGTSYQITWAAVNGATEYIVDESTDPGFGTVTTTTVTTTTATFTHTVTTDTRYYYRVRAHNHGGSCDLTSPNSDPINVLVHAAVVPPTRVIPVVGSTPGSFGSFFKTGLQLYNPTSATITGRMVYHVQGVDGAATDPSTTYSLAPGKTQSFTDLLPSFSQSGLGTLDVTADLGSTFPLTVTRIYNDAGAAGTTGMTEDLLSTDSALQSGDTGVLIAPPDFTKFRFNIGVRTLGNGVSMTVTVRDKDGVTLATLDHSFDPTFFQQTSSAAFLNALTLTGGETISLKINSGSAFIYGATTDNTTNDPNFQLAQKQ